MFALSRLAEPPVRVSLKCDPTLAEQLRGAHPAYHLNKRHWNTVIVDGSLPDTMIADLVEDSYDLVVSKLPRAARRALSCAAMLEPPPKLGSWKLTADQPRQTGLRSSPADLERATLAAEAADDRVAYLKRRAMSNGAVRSRTSLRLAPRRAVSPTLLLAASLRTSGRSSSRIDCRAGSCSADRSARGV